ncbi:MAG: 3,4-dihydroxy-2-butanone-4-phosphate synthase, partial [Bacilli bacterium]
VCIAEHAEPEVINLMIKHAKGMVSVGMTSVTAAQVGLPLQYSKFPRGNSCRMRNYTVSIDADETTTGISAPERSFSIKKFASSCSKEGFKQPGHIFPVIGEINGLYKKICVVEGSLDMARLSGCDGMTVICDILDKHGDMADEEDSRRLAEQLDLPIVTISDIIKGLLEQDGLLNSREVVNLRINQHQVRFVNYQVQQSLYQIGFKLQTPEQVRQALVETENHIRECIHLENDNYLSSNSSVSMIEAMGRLNGNNQNCFIFYDNAENQAPLIRNLVYLTIIIDIGRTIAKDHRDDGFNPKTVKRHLVAV